MSRFESARTTEHGYFEERLSAYLDGELTPGEHEAVKRHVTTCAACQWELETLGQTMQWTRELPAVAVPRVFTIPIPAQPERLSRRRWNFLPVLQGATALIAVLLVFTVAGDLMLGGLRMGSAPQQEAAPISVEVTQEFEAAAEAPVAAEPEAEVVVEKVVEETVVVESEVMMVAPTEAPLAMAIPPAVPAATPQPPSEEVQEGVTAAPVAASAADAATVEAEAAPRLAEEMVVGGGEAALTLTVPSTVTVGTELALAPAAAAERDETELGTTGEPGINWLRVVEFALGGALVLLAVATLFFTFARRGAR